MQDRGIDLDDPALRHRSGRWLRTRIVGLLSAPPVHVQVGTQVATVPANRLQHALRPQP